MKAKHIDVKGSVTQINLMEKQKMKLELRDSYAEELVTRYESPDFVEPPDVVFWGERVFLYDDVEWDHISIDDPTDEETDTEIEVIVYRESSFTYAITELEPKTDW